MRKKIQEKDIVKEIMNETSEKEATNSASKIPQSMDDDEAKLRASNPKKGFEILELGNGRYRIINKRRQWVSPVINFSEANILVNRLNQKDPEQKSYNLKQGIWNEKILEL